MYNELFLDFKLQSLMMRQKAEQIEKPENQSRNITNALGNDILSVYQDKYVKITPLYILIDKYYFPLATSKTIFFQEISSIQLKSSKGIHTVWGISRSQLNHWFHLDMERKNKKFFLSIELKDRKIKIGLSPQKPLEAFYKIRQLFTQDSHSGADIQMESNMSNFDKQEMIRNQAVGEVCSKTLDKINIKPQSNEQKKQIQE